MVVFPNCKINLGLQVIAKRSDGYHEVASVMYPVPINDILEIVPGKQANDEISFSGTKIPGKWEDNLIFKAIALLRQNFDIPPLKIHVHKAIPMGGGLGGGSSNGTYTLILLNDLFDLNLSENQLRDYASKLGSDCPFFVSNTAQLATGRGEILLPMSLDLGGKFLMLVNDGTHISTQMAYGSIQPKLPEQQLLQIIECPLEDWQNVLVNDFEAPIMQQFPKLKTLKEKLMNNGAIYAAMTGSGSTMFGIFEKNPAIDFGLDNGFVNCVQLK
ncbi:MAG: 4-(cytidine 5'-diphospho)-2-C-methyl-D-erythritol kinase [Crocinitomicaceae bacterium]|nr:4-(cytidine 5'-diphospho)-2-C-methyl-D-erythritol kinase [Crocinitomicaceae bacterium]